MSNSRQGFRLNKPPPLPVAKVPEKSNFAHTCNLLSQYVKEKGGLKDLNLLGICGKSEASTTGKSNVTTPTTMNLLSNIEDMKQQAKHFLDSLPQLSTVVPDEEAMGAKRSQMTIFYGNQVLVFDDLPADKAREVMQLASSRSSSCNPASQIAEKYCSELERPQPQLQTEANTSDLPIARRSSLHRFLEKRKKR